MTNEESDVGSVAELGKHGKRQRLYADYFAWPDQPVEEAGVLEQLIESMEIAGEPAFKNPKLHRPDPPDCTADLLVGGLAAIEASELVSKEAISKNLKGGRVYANWSIEDVRGRITNILQKKDAKRLNGGPYSRFTVVVYTAEMMISQYRDVIASESFGPVRSVTDAYLLFQYDPMLRRCPYVALKLERS